MYQINHKTKKGGSIHWRTSSIEKLRKKIKAYWKARKECEAKDDDGNIVAAVYHHEEAGLVWFSI